MSALATTAGTPSAIYAAKDELRRRLRSLLAAISEDELLRQGTCGTLEMASSASLTRPGTCVVAVTSDISLLFNARPQCSGSSHCKGDLASSLPVCKEGFDLRFDADWRAPD